MNNTIAINDIADELLIFNKHTIDALFSLENCADCVALYAFYYKTAKWQKTNTIKAVDLYVKKSLGWGIDKIRRTKQALKDKGLIKIIQRRKDNKIDGWYIEVAYIVSEEKTKGAKVVMDDTSNNTQNQQHLNPTSRKEETNALKEQIRCLKNENKMLKNKIDTLEKNQGKPKKEFIKPTIEEVRTYVLDKNLNVDPEYFYDYYEANGWRVGKDTVKMKDWQATLRNWHRRNLNNPRQQASTRAVAQLNTDDQPYEPEPTEDIRPWQEFFDEWQEILGMRPAQTVGNVRAAKQLKAENDDEMLTALMVALAMRSQTRYLTREIKNITTPLDLLNNRERVWSFYQEHRETWKWQQSMRRGAGLIN